MAGPLNFTRVLTADGIGLERYECGHSVLREFSEAIDAELALAAYDMSQKCSCYPLSQFCTKNLFMRMLSRCYGVASFPSSVFPSTVLGVCDVLCPDYCLRCFSGSLQYVNLPEAAGDPFICLFIVFIFVFIFIFLFPFYLSKTLSFIGRPRNYPAYLSKDDHLVDWM